MNRAVPRLLPAFVSFCVFALVVDGRLAHAQAPGLTLPPNQLVLTSELDIDPGQIFINTCQPSTSYGGNLFFGIHAGNCHLTSTLPGEAGQMQGSFNTAVGYYAAASLSSGFNNTVVGSLAGNTLTAGAWQTLIGYRAGELMQQSIDSTAIGAVSMQNLVFGDLNTAVGTKTFYLLNGGSGNVALGWWAGTGLAEYMPGYENEASLIDNFSMFIGPLASRHASLDRHTPLFNATAIGYNAKVGASNTLVLGGEAENSVNVSVGSPVAPSRFWVPGEIGTGLYLDPSNYEYASLTSTAGSIALGARTSGTGSSNVDIILAPAGYGSVRVTTALTLQNNTGVMAFERGSGSKAIAMFMDSSDRIRIGLLDTTNFFMGADGSILLLQGASSYALLGNLAGAGKRPVCATTEGKLVAC